MATRDVWFSLLATVLVRLARERARVVEITVAPGEREPVHAHCLPETEPVLPHSYENVDTKTCVRCISNSSASPTRHL
jgi:hypothetical protein